MTMTQQLKSDADKVEAHAKDSLTAWTILRETHKYEAAMEQVRNLRRAAELKGSARREFMDSKGLR